MRKLNRTRSAFEEKRGGVRLTLIDIVTGTDVREINKAFGDSAGKVAGWFLRVPRRL